MADVSITASNVVPPTVNTTTHNQPTTIIASEAISAGQVVCLLANGQYALACATDNTRQAVVGIAGSSAALGQRVDVVTASPALAVGTHGVTVGTPLYVSANHGMICPYADLGSGALPILVAYAATTTTFQVDIAAALNPKP